MYDHHQLEVYVYHGFNLCHKTMIYAICFTMCLSNIYLLEFKHITSDGCIQFVIVHKHNLAIVLYILIQTNSNCVWVQTHNRPQDTRINLLSELLYVWVYPFYHNACTAYTIKVSNKHNWRLVYCLIAHTNKRFCELLSNINICNIRHTKS